MVPSVLKGLIFGLLYAGKTLLIKAGKTVCKSADVKIIALCTNYTSNEICKGESED